MARSSIHTLSSQRLSSFKMNFDIGNHELLAVRLALEEWCHWLDGAIHPFLIWSDHIQTELQADSGFPGSHLHHDQFSKMDV